MVIKMDAAEKQGKHFVGYEYKEVSAEGSRASLLMDGYENFGWEIDGNVQSKNKVTLHLKRNRKIVNKMELTRLQRNFEACVAEIDALERAKTSTATIWALVTALAGTAFLAGSVFAITAPAPYIVLSILLSVPGIIGWILPYFLYKKLVEKQTRKLTPLIEAKYDEIYELCEKGNKLL